jgi:hypothetical protein
MTTLLATIRFLTSSSFKGWPSKRKSWKTVRCNDENSHNNLVISVHVNLHNNLTAEHKITKSRLIHKCIMRTLGKKQEKTQDNRVWYDSVN